ncbi:glycosyltransferase family 4 protein [Prosthecobacter vanneervenii]|uniref:Glycosyltransferase involved in cell wall biosynthesis n=1 Tax=Prosthecobacter vanneervenii TaxID=48466 RepID=A0A7W8DJ67_9BACT|nr:glycosyltransferase family 4 protein [Prosthecobacter vanneervenii]MBB5031715.1 glycosyltransferase involved in cell wall biosynthesis [Prosthecobacter vanneervenii]
MKIAATGYVSEQAGSVASANALLLRALLDAGHEVDFFSKPSFVDPRPCVGEHEGFRFVSTDNVGPDRFRARVQHLPIIGFLACRVDSGTYSRLLLQNISREHKQRRYDLCLWLGDYAPGRVKNLPMISFAQGPPGTDARSIISRFSEILRLAGLKRALPWYVLALVRLSPAGLPPLRHSDHIIVGSRQSQKMLHEHYGVSPERTSALPYPIDLNMFRQPAEATQPGTDLRVVWLGRIIPRKRLDLFLQGLELAIRQGLRVKATIVGGIGFVPGYEKMIESFPFPDRLRWIKSLPRTEVPALLHQHDVLAQPSDEENFGSSVAEAQACGLRSIVGHTNGNSAYLCERDIHLEDDRPESFSKALIQMAAKTDQDTSASRAVAELHFDISRVAASLTQILRHVVDQTSPRDMVTAGTGTNQLAHL